MLAIARAARARHEHADRTFLRRRRARARRFPIASFDVAVSLRVLMHTPRWRVCVDELCRVARSSVVVDYPVGAQRGARCSRWPARSMHALGARDRAVPGVLRPRDRRRASRANGFRIRSMRSPVRAADRPAQGHRIAARSRTASKRVLRAARPARAVRIAGDARRRTVRVLVTGATGFTGGHLARGAGSARATTVRALVARSGAGRATSPRPASNSPSAICATGRRSTRRCDGIDVVYNIAAIYRQAGMSTRRRIARSTPRRSAS